jgi:uncharacterized membrane protein (UPF0127 family)
MASRRALDRKRCRRYIAVMIRIAWVFVFTLFIAGAEIAPASAQMPGGLAKFPTGSLAIESGGKTHRFTIEIATNSRQQSQGLMFRRHLARDAGMLFVYRRVNEIAMWMRNTYVPLDMLFIRKDGRIGKIAERTVPLSEETISSGGPVIAVLELNAGTSERLGIKVGDRVRSPALPGGAE